MIKSEIRRRDDKKRRTTIIMREGKGREEWEGKNETRVRVKKR